MAVSIIPYIYASDALRRQSGLLVSLPEVNLDCQKRLKQGELVFLDGTRQMTILSDCSINKQSVTVERCMYI